jgi:hypothetical protein
MFSPGRIDVKTGETKATLSWNPSLFTEGKAVQYTVQIAKDSSFQTIEKTMVVDTTALTITEDELAIKQKFVARIKANTYNNTPESNWIISPSFSMTGEQIFLNIDPITLKDKSVVLSWRERAGLTKIVLMPTGGQAQEVTLGATDIAARQKLVTGLTPSTAYKAEIFAGAKSVGIVSFTTKELSVFTTEITDADNLIEVINNAENNDVIGLKPGTYSYITENLTITNKHITLRSTSGDWKNTKVLFKEITLKGTGAGVRIMGLEFDGTPGAASYFLNLVGLNAEAEAATFKSIWVENSVIHGTANCLIRANRAAANDHKIESIKFDNTVAYDNGASTYNYFSLNKLEFKSLQLLNSTFYNTARAFIGWETNMTVSAMPTILISQTTINGFGFGNRNNILFDANGNVVDFMMQNSIVANVPKPGQTLSGSSLLRAGTGSNVKVEYSNLFNLNNGATPAVDLTFPSLVQQTSVTNINLGWTYTTSDFTLPANSPLRSSGKGGVAIGDPRWAK